MGYWTRVFDRAAQLLRERPSLNGDSAYWMARNEIDAELQSANRQEELPSEPAPDLKLT